MPKSGLRAVVSALLATRVRASDSRLRVRALFGPGPHGQDLHVEVVNTGGEDVVVDIRPEVIVRVDAFAGLVPGARRTGKAIPVRLVGDPLPCRVPSGAVRRWSGSLDRVVYRLGRDFGRRDHGYVVVRPAGGRPRAVRMRSG